MNILKYLPDIIPTVYFNFRVLPFKEAIKLPFFVSHKYKWKIEDYKAISIDVPIDKIKRFMVRFVNGGSADIIPNKYGIIVQNDGGKIIFKGDCQFSAGCSVRSSGGVISFGENFSANRNCNLSATKEIKFDNNVLLGFRVSVRDSDGHNVIYKEKRSENTNDIHIGNHVWICAGAIITKGVQIGSDSVVSAKSMVLRGNYNENTLIAGSPAKVVKEDINWEL